MGEITIIAAKRVRKQIEKLPQEIKTRIDEVLDVLKLAPLPVKNYDVKKIKGKENIYRIRIGDYRLIYRYEKKRMCIEILLVLPRRKAYKKF